LSRLVRARFPSRGSFKQSPLLYSPLADLSRKCALGSLLDCFGKLLAPLFQSSFSWSVSWFFGPSLLPAFTGFLHYYGLCWLLPGSRPTDLPE